MLSWRILCWILSVFVLHTSVAFSQNKNLNPEDIHTEGIKFSFPHHSTTNTYEVLEKETDAYIQKIGLEKLLQQTEFKPLVRTVEIKNSFGEMVQHGQFKLIHQEGQLIQHLLPLKEPFLYIKVPKVYLKKIPMNFLETHLAEQYPTQKTNRQVLIYTDQLKNTQSAFLKENLISKFDKDMMAKSVVMNLAYNNKVSSMSDTEYKNFLNGGIQNIIEKETSPITSQYMKNVIVPLRNFAVESINQKLHFISIEMKLYDILLNIEYNIQDLENSLNKYIEAIGVKNVEALESLWYEFRNDQFDRANHSEIEDIVSDKLELVIHRLGEKWNIDAALYKAIESTVKFNEIELERAKEELVKRVKIKNLEFNHLKLGQTEFTAVEEKLILRLRPFGTEKVFLWIPKGLINKNSKTLKKYIARQSVYAGTDRTDGQKGRDVVMMWVDELPLRLAHSKNLQPLIYNKSISLENLNHKEDIVEMNRPTKAVDKVKVWLNASYQSPSKEDARLAIYCAIIHPIVGGGLDFVNNGFSLDTVNIMISLAIFSGGIGYYNKTYSNIVYSKATRAASGFKDRMFQSLKASTVSLTFALVMTTIKQGNVFDFTSLYMTIETLRIIADKYLNALGSSYIKTELAQPAKLKINARLDTNTFKIKLPFTEKTFDTKVKEGSWSIQVVVQSKSILLRLLDLFKVGGDWNLTLSETMKFQGSYGSLVFYGSLPLIKWWNTVKAYKEHPKEAEKAKLKEKWDNFLLNPMKLHINAPKAIKAPFIAARNHLRIKKFTKEVRTYAANNPIHSQFKPINPQKAEMRNFYNKPIDFDLKKANLNRCVNLFSIAL